MLCSCPAERTLQREQQGAETFQCSQAKNFTKELLVTNHKRGHKWLPPLPLCGNCTGRHGIVRKTHRQCQVIAPALHWLYKAPSHTWAVCTFYNVGLLRATRSSTAMLHAGVATAQYQAAHAVRGAHVQQHEFYSLQYNRCLVKEHKFIPTAGQHNEARVRGESEFRFTSTPKSWNISIPNQLYVEIQPTRAANTRKSVPRRP
jgi:hypothetical protein